MKILFLDIDGVLNSARFASECLARGVEGIGVDETRLPLLRRILEETGAFVVLSTSWRVHWDADPALCAPDWDMIGAPLAAYGIEAYDKTPVLEGDERDGEIRAWLDAHRDTVESFAILDDRPFGWGDLADRLVATRYDVGRGLEIRHAERAILLLNTPCVCS